VVVNCFKARNASCFQSANQGEAVTVDASCFHSANQGAAVNVVTIFRLKFPLEPSKQNKKNITKERLCKKMIIKRDINI